MITLEKRKYKSFLYVIGYLLILRVVLMVTTNISVFNLGILFDTVLMLFWIGAFGFFMKKLLVQKIYYVVIIIVATVFVVGDSVYYGYFEVISAGSSFEGLKWLREGTTLEYSIQIPLVAYLITPLLIGVIYLIIRNKEKDVFVIKDFGFLSLVFLVQAILFFVWGSYSFDTRIEYYRSDAYLFESMYDRSLFSEKYGYYNYHILDFTRIRTKTDSNELYNEVDEFFENKDDHIVNDYSDIFEGYNIVAILGETLETRFINPVLTPNLYLMQSEGMSFDNFFTPVFQQGATCNSEFMSITGMSAITSNDWSNNICDSYSENTFTYALPEQLNGIGYDTYYFHSGHEWFYNRKTIIPQYGFDTVAFQEDLIEAGNSDFNEKFDTEILSFFDEYVDYTNPVYINILTYSMHGAYDQEEFFKYQDRVDAAYPLGGLDSEIVNYMEKLVEFDNMLWLIMDELEANDELDNTLFVIYPDHFPYMMNTNTYLEFIGEEDDTHEYMRQELIIYSPTMMDGEVISKPGSTIDIAPTVLNMIDSSLVFKYFLGTDLLSDEDNYILFSDLTISDGEAYLYLNEELLGHEVHYAILEEALEYEITALEIQKKILIIDYFKLKEEE